MGIKVGIPSQKVNNGGQKLRKDAVLGFSLIVKPPAEYINALSPAERDKFFDDSDAIIFDLMGTNKVTGKHNICSTARHRDEQSEHKHIYLVFREAKKR